MDEGFLLGEVRDAATGRILKPLVESWMNNLRDSFPRGIVSIRPETVMLYISL